MASQATDAAAGKWVKCAGCKELVYRKQFEALQRVCPLCNYHQRLRAAERIGFTADEGSFSELFAEIISGDPLGFPDYGDKLRGVMRQTAMNEAVVTGEATIGGYPVVLGVLDFHFRAGTMSAAVGTKVAKSMEHGRATGRPVIQFIASGGARVHEGLHALTQMAKTSAAVARLQAAKVPFLVVLTDPSMAGVMASYASLGDITIAEPGALIGFTGPRVIEQTCRIKLPPDHQTSEFQLEHGQVDLVCDRIKLKPTIVALLRALVGPRAETKEGR